MGRLAVFCRLGCAVVLGGAVLWSGGVLAAGHCAEVPWLRVAPGIWVWAPAQVEDVSEANGGFVAPVTALVDRGEALVIDPGPSHRHGLRVRESLRCRFGARVTAVVNTHAHAENVLGNSAFADLQASGLLRIWAAAGTQVAMRARCAQCLEGLTHSAGREALRGTRWVVPDAALVPGDELVVGRHRVQVMAVEQGHTEADLVLRHSATGVVWAGGLVYDGRLPELAQGGLLPWLEALDRLHALAPRLLVSASVSRSAPGGESLHSLAATHDYLDALRVRVLAAMDQGLSPWDAQQLELSRFALWAGYAQRHHFNVQRAWRELEPVWMNRSPESAQQVGW